MRQEEEEVGYGTSDRIPCSAEFQAESAIRPGRSARQNHRVPAARSQEVCVIRVYESSLRNVFGFWCSELDGTVRVFD
jgi:hypothetical protein